MTKQIPGGITGVHHQRMVHPTECWPALKEAYYRNHLEITYQERCEEQLDSYGRPKRTQSWEHISDMLTAKKFQKQIIEFLDTHAVGLFWVMDPTPKGDFGAVIRVMFELREEMDRFRKDFLVLHKLSN